MQLTTLAVGQLGTNCHLIVHDGECLIVDPGDEAKRILRLVDGKTVAALLLTHGHVDHIGAVDELHRETGAPVYIHALDAPQLPDPQLNLSAFLGQQLSVQAKPVLLQGGETLRLAGLEIAVIHTPGHTPGGVCFDFGDTLLAGDTLFHESVGRTDFPGGSMETLATSIRAVYALGDRVVHCGHGPSTSLAHERRCNPFVTA